MSPHLMQAHGSQVILLASRSELMLFTIDGVHLIAFQDHQRPITSIWVVSVPSPARGMLSSLGHPQPCLI